MKQRVNIGMKEEGREEIALREGNTDGEEQESERRGRFMKRVRKGRQT